MIAIDSQNRMYTGETGNGNRHGGRTFAPWFSYRALTPSAHKVGESLRHRTGAPHHSKRFVGAHA
ncbi:MAG: hypothetical protein O3A53_15935 [Acidobacteria bacterium]|nr:hypothetical protein [Acidobacteriota bacterium]MDA1236276.1 hypothetical protein [Acidobacteriota bacterium]